VKTKAAPWRRGSQLIACVLLGAAPAVYAQVAVERGPIEFTMEGYANVTTGAGDLLLGTDGFDDGLRVDAAFRGLARWRNPSGADAGLRLVVEASPENDVEVAEASVLIFGETGRVEIGDRQGLPDVLTGYAPNNFTFTGAEFGPASGPSLDPAGGLQTAFLDDALAAQLRELSVLGFAASLSDDRSAKALYVSPKWRGLLAGLSYAANATDLRFKDLVQAGLTHDRYWNDNVLHVGGSYSFGRAAREVAGQRDLHSINLGATLVLNYDWMLGASVGYDGSSGTSGSASPGASIDDAWGTVVSLNYNQGPWTAGAFAQWSTREGDVDRRGDDRLRALEAGLSYRVSTKLRFYGAWYYFDFDDEGGALTAERHGGTIVLVGLRATL
jgi:hypothetical protein